MFKKFAQAAAGIGIGLLVYQGLQNKKAEDQSQECVVRDTKTVPGMVYYFNQCNRPINVYACVKYLADDAISIFSKQNSRNCETKQVAPDGGIVVGNLYDEKAGWLWNAVTISQVKIMACIAPKTPELKSENQFVCK